MYSFGGPPDDGAFPAAALIDVGGTLYGTTEYGGVGYGTVFSITPTGKENVLYTFNGTDGANPIAPLIDVKGTFYGTTEYGGAYTCSRVYVCGTLFSLAPSGAEIVLHSFGNGDDGAFPAAGLTNADGTLYGTTIYGGAYNFGTVFAWKL